jgi:hypothetical protein
MVVDIVVGGPAGGLGLLRRRLLQLQQVGLGLDESGLDAAARVGHGLADIAAGALQQRLGVGDHQLQVAHQAVGLGGSHFGHRRFLQQSITQHRPARRPMH